jgi:DNA-binding response OmpR family regulator
MSQTSHATTPDDLRVLVVDDDALVLEALTRMLRRTGHEVHTASDFRAALEVLAREPVDLVLTDLVMPGGSGIDLLREIRTSHSDVPVIVLTGEPGVASAMKALEYGAFRYLAKPVHPNELTRIVADAAKARGLSKARDPLGARADLERRFHLAMDGLWMAAQPILATQGQHVVGWEMLMRSREPSLPHPGAVIEAAEQLSAVHALGRRVRSLTAEIIAKGPPARTYFVNVHPADLADSDLLDTHAPLSQHAKSIVLELTERSTLEGVGGVEERLKALRAMDYRIAVDDLGSGYAGLS